MLVRYNSRLKVTVGALTLDDCYVPPNLEILTNVPLIIIIHFLAAKLTQILPPYYGEVEGDKTKKGQ